MEKNKEKVVLIAGVENSVGASVASKLKQSGWKVLGMDLEIKGKSVDELDGYYSLDMTNRDDFKEIVKTIEKTYDIAILFCATGFEEDRKSEDFLSTSMEQWQKTLDGWLRSSINACAAVAPNMVSRKEGRIMILSPDFSKLSGDNTLMATAAGTLHGFAKSLGVEVAKDNVLVNCIYPNIPFDHEAIAAMAQFLADSGNYVSAQVISIRDKGKGR